MKGVDNLQRKSVVVVVLGRYLIRTRHEVLALLSGLLDLIYIEMLPAIFVTGSEAIALHVHVDSCFKSNGLYPASPLRLSRISR